MSHGKVIKFCLSFEPFQIKYLGNVSCKKYNSSAHNTEATVTVDFTTIINLFSRSIIEDGATF